MSLPWPVGRHAPHVVYANLNFRRPGVPHGARFLLLWLETCGPSWNENQTLRFLEKHQGEFRNCLQWLSDNSLVDFGPLEDEDAERRFREEWERKSEVRFLQQHGLDHGGVTLAPALSDPQYPFQGLELDQKKARDPLDPICWYMLTLLAGYGTVFVRRCGYRNCGKFIWPRTARKLFCSDSCRALSHAARKMMDLMLDEVQGGEQLKKFRRSRAEYMREHRANPSRRLIEYRRAEKSRK